MIRYRHSRLARLVCAWKGEHINGGIWMRIKRPDLMQWQDSKGRELAHVPHVDLQMYVCGRCGARYLT